MDRVRKRVALVLLGLALVLAALVAAVAARSHVLAQKPGIYLAEEEQETPGGWFDIR